MNVLLQATEQRIREHGLLKGSSVGNSGERCLASTIRFCACELSSPFTEEWSSRIAHVMAAMAEDPVLIERIGDKANENHSNYPEAHVIFFNDHPGTTQEDVLALIERAQQKLQ